MKKEYTFIMTKSDTIKANFAELPIVDTSRRYLVEVLQPVAMVPREISLRSENPLSDLKNLLLSEWQENFEKFSADSSLDWIKTVNKVELVECDLLVPRA